LTRLPKKRWALTNTPLDQRYLATLSPVDQEIHVIVSHWKSWRKDYIRDYQRLRDSTTKKADVRTLTKAKSIMRWLLHWSGNSRDFDLEIRLVVKTIEGLDSAINWRSRMVTRPGKMPEAIIAQCAEDVAELFKEVYDSPRWKSVGEIIAQNFPDYLPPDDGARDLRLWIYNMVKRHRKLRRDNSAYALHPYELHLGRGSTGSSLSI
jgi:hypothetical protein